MSNICRTAPIATRRSNVHMRSLRKIVTAILFLPGLWLAHPVSPTRAVEPCAEWVAKVVSIEGNVQVRRADEMQWRPVAINESVCSGDVLDVQPHSRAALVLRNEAVLRLDQNTVVNFAPSEHDRVSVLELLSGAAHFFSRTPRSLKINTPFVNAAVEGTEFFVRVERDQTSLSVFTGRVLAVNDFGSLVLENGQSAEAQTGKAPVLKVVVRPRDAVQWALYYPPILEEARQGHTHELAAAPQPSPPLAEELLGDGRQTPRAARHPEPPAASADAHALNLQAARLLAVGCVAEATTALDQALRGDPASSDVYALQAIIAVVQNDKARALQLAGRAVDLNGRSAAAAIALSYAQQASFDLPGATRSLQTAVHNAPQNALALARLAELWLSQGYLDRAEEEARRAASLNPYLGRTQTVLGFAYLTRIKTEESRKAFEQAIELEQGDPLPRLGLGLAKIRDGDLKGGRQEIEIAADLDPNNSLVRSYMGKAYYEEKRGRLASDQFAIAKELDPKDPTPGSMTPSKSRARTARWRPWKTCKNPSSSMTTAQCTARACSSTTTWRPAASAWRASMTTSAFSNWHWSKAGSRSTPTRATFPPTASWRIPTLLCPVTKSPG
jgi:Tfp pilus assembly protein PilF